MGKTKYTEEIRNKAIELRLAGKSSTEITEETGMGKESQNKLFKKMGIKLTEEQAAVARARRWLDHEPVVDNKKLCSKCGENLFTDEFNKDNNKISGLTSWCKKCSRSYYEENAETIKQRSRDYARNNPEKKKECAKRWYKDSINKQHKIDLAKEWSAKNPEKRKVIQHEYDKRNQPQKNARTAHYRASKIQATPPWLTQQQLDEMRRMYENCPPGFQVDHIVPLRGKEVSGLHIPWNLQYLPAEENNKKGNRM